MSNIVGIDLGTTFSALAVLNSIGRPETIPVEGSERLMPSAVYFERGGEKVEEIVGKEALHSRVTNVDRSARLIKRYMGSPFYPDKVDGSNWSPAKLSSFILKELKKECSGQIGEIKDVVITVPAHFDEVRRKATMDAGEAAGLNVVGIVNEPTAAALFYAITQEVAGRILVFDLGGGTFDVTVMDVKGKDVSIVCSDGDPHLGGYDFDQKILDRFDKAYRSKFGVTLYPNAEEKARYELRAEEAKKTLSRRPSAKEMLFGSAGNLPFEISREEFEADISPFIAKIEMLIESVLDEAENKPGDIDKVLLVGGSSRIPLIQTRLERIFGFEPTTAVNLDEAVALGAALYAGLRLMESDTSKVPVAIAAGLGDVKLQDVCNHSYGTIVLSFDDHLKTRLMKNDIIIPKNTPLPCEIEKTYTTVSDGQDALDIRITQGESEEPDFVTTLVEASMPLPSGRPRGRPIRVTYGYNKDQRMLCTFVDVEAKRRMVVDFDAKTGESRTTIEGLAASVSDFIVE